MVLYTLVSQLSGFWCAFICNWWGKVKCVSLHCSVSFNMCIKSSPQSLDFYSVTQFSLSSLESDLHPSRWVTVVNNNGRQKTELHLSITETHTGMSAYIWHIDADTPCPRVLWAFPTFLLLLTLHNERMTRCYKKKKHEKTLWRYRKATNL